MIESHRDEDFCRRWDALADEDHTHFLTAQEYFHYKNKWWLHSNKQGSITMPLRHRSDFLIRHRLPWNDCNKKQEKNHMCLLLQAQTMGGTKFIFYMVQLGRFMVDSLSFRKSRRRWHQVLSERYDPFLVVFGKILLDKTFLNSIYFGQDWSFTADGGLL